MTSTQPDADLIARSRSDPAAFAGIFDRHHAELYRYLCRRIGAGLAADLAAETFVTAFARRGAYRADTRDARPWLYGIAHNLLRNHLRTERRQFAAYARHGADPLADPDASTAFATADARADSAVVGRRLAQILATMPSRDRDVLLLFAWADMSYAEIGQALNIPVGTVRSRLSRARHQLRALVNDGALTFTEREAWTNWLLLSEFRSDTPGPSVAETAGARDVLFAAMARARTARAPRPARRAAGAGRSAQRIWLPAVAVGCAAAVAIAAAVVMAPGQRTNRAEHRPAALTAAYVLRKAASAAASQSADHGRFFVAESEYIIPGNGQDAPAKRIIWIGNGVTGRLLQGGPSGGRAPIPPGISFGRRVITWAQLLRLPTTPGRLLAVIAKASRNTGQPPLQAEFGTIVGLLFESPTSPALRSALFSAASRLAGVKVVADAHDLIGRAATEVYVPPGIPGNGGEALFFDPSTSAVLGTAGLVGSTVQCPPMWEYAVLASGYVNSKHQLPPGAQRSLKPVSWLRSAPGCPAPTSGQVSASPSPSARPSASPSR